MKLVKVRNSIRIEKASLILVLLFFIHAGVWAQIIPSQPQNQNPTRPQTNSNGIPNQENPRQAPNPNRTPINRVPVTGTEATNARTIELTVEDQAAITREDSIRMAIEDQDAEDLALTTLRRRIFGYKYFSQAVYDPNAAINIPTPNNYALGAGDQLVIDIYGAIAPIHQETTVNADGLITVPNAGPVKVGNMGMDEAKRAIKSALKKSYPGIDSYIFVSVNLGNIRSIKVNILGDVIAPGTYTMTSFSTALNAMYACGGPSEVGSYRRINIIRDNKVIKTLDLYDILISGKSDDNILLKDQDVIQVPPVVNRVITTGFLNRTGLFETIPGETIQNLLDYSGGFNKDAYQQRVKIYRNTKKERRILDIDYPDFENIPVLHGDSLVVERILERFENLVSIEGAIFRPGEYSLSNNPTLTKLINTAEGLREDALATRISVLRTNDDLSIENFSFNLRNINSGLGSDFELRRLDQVLVPSIFDLTEVAFIRISGAINNPDAEEGVELPYVKNMTIQDVMVRVGGVTEAASLSNIEIVRRKRNVDPSKANAQIADIILVDLDEQFQMQDTKESLVLQPYDEIIIRNSPNYQEQIYVEIQGEVLFPSVYGVKTKEERISDILERAGGLTLQAYPEGATLIRTVELSEIELQLKRRALEGIAGAGTNTTVVNVEEVEPTQQQSIGIDLNRIINRPGGIDDLILQDGDIIRIPRVLQTIRVQGEVLYPNTVKYIDNNTFKDYISNAGGFTKRSLRGASYVIYANGSVDRTRRFLGFNIYPKVRPGSEIIVPERAQNTAESLNRVSGIVQTLSATIGALVGIYGLVQLNRF